jgi:hypothetical protein
MIRVSVGGTGAMGAIGSRHVPVRHHRLSACIEHTALQVRVPAFLIRWASSSTIRYLIYRTGREGRHMCADWERACTHQGTLSRQPSGRDKDARAFLPLPRVTNSAASVP